MRLHWLTRIGAAATLALGSTFVVAVATDGPAAALPLPPLTLPPLTVPPVIGGLLGSTTPTLPASPVPIAAPVAGTPTTSVTVTIPPSPIPLPGPVSNVTGTVSGAIDVIVGGDATTTTLPGGDATTTTTVGGDTTTTTVGSGSTTTTAGGSTTTTTAGGSTTSTTVGAQQTTVHGQSTTTNNCPVTLNPPVMSVDPATVTATISTDAFPQPHQGDPIKLTKTKATITVPGSVVQAGVDAGILHDGDSIPTTVTLVVAGSATKEKTHTYKESGNATVKVVNGQAQDMSSTFSLPDTTWTPVDATSNVFFTEKSMTIVSTLTVPGLGDVTATLDCTPTDAPPFVAVAAQGTEIPTPSGSTGGATPAAASGATSTPVAATAASGGTSSLPFTGGSTAVLLALAASLLALGLAVKRGANRARARVGT